MNHKKKWVLELEGLTPYGEAYELQTRLVQARKGRIDRDLFICLEHEPVFTLGRRGGRENLRVPEKFLSAKGISIVHVERGGDITYHGPGQVVLYPIIALSQAGLSVVDHVTALEEVMIRTAADWEIRTERNPLNRGVWVGGCKLGSIGIAVRRGVAFHGLALNANTSLEHFGWINPCGLQNVSITTMSQILARSLSMDEVRRSLLGHVEEVFGAVLEPISLDQVRTLIAG
jgi:lipoyl(octanoyl) transferase